MNPPPGKGGGSADGPGRAELDALRARIEAAQRGRAGAGRPARTPRRGGQAGRRRQAGADRAGEEAEEARAYREVGSAAEAPDPEPPTPLDDASRTGGRWWDDHPGKPIPVEDGIAASTRRGPIGATWWSQRFLTALEGVLVGGRMERGRTYARKGQVVSLSLEPGTVTAVVQGSRAEPYRTRLTMAPAADEDWDRIVAALASQARFAAALLAGELPHQVEEVFEASGASLFPGPQARLITECTCPDFENPCKHVAAVCYLVAEMFDRDPFLVLEWRGRDRAWVVEALRQLRNAPASEAGAHDGTVPPAGGAGRDPRSAAGGRPDDLRSEADPDGDPVDLSPEAFWTAGPGLSEVRVRPVPAPVPDAVLRQLERGLLRVGDRDVADVLTPAYEALTAAGLPPD